MIPSAAKRKTIGQLLLSKGLVTQHVLDAALAHQKSEGAGGRHKLVGDATGTLRIRLQRVDLFNSQAQFDYVLQIWV